MKKENLGIEKKLFKIIAKLLEVNLKKISINSSANNLEEFDSLGILNIMSYFEKSIKSNKIKLDPKDFGSIKNILKFVKKNKIKL